MRWSAFVILAAACRFDPRVAAGDAATADGDTVDASIGADADAEIDGNVNVDGDGDGVLDASDNCVAVPNADQHDEDVDLIGDACDPCPQLAAASADADGDGIGEACDPHPGVGGDVLLRFDTFAAGPLAAAWVSTVGDRADWQVAGDDLAIALAATSSARFLVLETGQPHHRIDIGFELTANAATSPAITTFVDEDAPGNNADACSTRIAGGPGPGVLFEAFANGVFSTIEQDNVTPPVPGTYRMVMTVDGAGRRCAVTTPDNDHTFTRGTVGANRTHVGIRVRDLAATIRYIAVYTSP